MIVLSEEWRVRPLDHLQWVLERRRPNQLRAGGERWDAQAYCRTRAGLETALSRLKAENVVLDASLLASLPDYFDGTPAKITKAARPPHQSKEI
jgi:hypothetical protein